jgi:hypothetical protein
MQTDCKSSIIIEDMWRLLERERERQRELRAGVDADLVQANHKRFRTALSLVGMGLLFSLLGKKLNLPGVIRTVFGLAAMAAFLIGIVTLWWAEGEQRFLNGPDPEGPPKIFKD